MGTLLILASMFSLVSAPGRCAQPKSPPAGSSFQVKFVGEGGGFSQLPPDASDAIETGAQQSGASSGWTQPVPKPKPNPGPAPLPGVRPTAPLPLHPALTRPRPVVTRPQTGAAAAEPAAAAEADRSRYSLWEGLSAPMELPAKKVEVVSEDQAADLGRRDYESHILGQEPADSASPAAVAAGSWGSGSGASSAHGSAPEVFVALNLDMKKQPDATFKDAVADVVRVSGFRPDARFAPAALGKGPDQVALWGWISPDRMGAALQVPAVARLEVSPAAHRASPATSTDMVLGLRLPPGRSPAEAVSELERDASLAGLRVRRTVGTQTVPGTAETVVVLEASVPISALARLMAHRGVVKMIPAPPPPAAPQKPQRRVAEELRRFLAFVMGQSPMLLVLTLLMLLPWVGTRLAAAARVFVPYR
ncbi:MAG: hypothetical protein PHU21_07535 [Elusimicrobia bacterium]|nr:hypothetical protein [Elusimicrobiota bacterium]